MHENLNFSRAGTNQSAKPTDQVNSADSISAMDKSARLTALVGQANFSKSAKTTVLVNSADSPVTNSVNSLEKHPNWPNVTSSDVGANLED